MMAAMHITELFSVEGKVAVVTGGSRGIGEMIAEGLVRNGVRTYITARKAEACDATAARLGEYGECVSIPAYLSAPEGLAAFVAAFSEREDRLDILVNNAGAACGAVAVLLSVAATPASARGSTTASARSIRTCPASSCFPR